MSIYLVLISLQYINSIQIKQDGGLVQTNQRLREFSEAKWSILDDFWMNVYCSIWYCEKKINKISF